MTINLILASSSPRRRELIALLGYDFIVCAADADETFLTSLTPQENVMRTAAAKACAVLNTAGHHRENNAYETNVIIGVDTVVVLDGIVFGKPADAADARRMLSAYSGKIHEVVSGVCLLGDDRRKKTFSVSTAVRFRQLSSNEIDEYLESGEAWDKSGAYGIQGSAAKFIPGIDGDYYNVMGFPVSEIYRHLKEWESDIGHEKIDSGCTDSGAGKS